MKPIHFNLDSTVNYGDLQEQVASAVKRELGDAVWSSGIEELNSEAVNVSMFIRTPGDVFLGHSIADRNYFWTRDAAGDRLINRFRTVLVPGRWMKKRLLQSPSIQLAPHQIVCAGSPRIDTLRALASNVVKVPSISGRPKILWAPTHSRKGGQSVSSHPEFERHLPSLTREFDVVSLLHPRQRDSKLAATHELLSADIVISDTSSIIYEAWALGKPVIFPSWLVSERALTRYPRSAEAHIYTERIGYHPRDIHELQDILRSGPTIGADVHRFMDEYLDNYRAGNASQKVADTLKKLAGANPSHDELSALHEAVEATEQPALQDTAIDRQTLVSDCQDLIGRAEGDASLLAQLAGLLLRLKEPERAERAFRDVLALDWNVADNHAQLAHALALQGKWWQAVDALETAVSLDGNQSEWHFRLGEARERMGRYELAASAYQAAIELDPQLAPWHYRFGYALERSGQRDRAQAAYAEAIRLDGGSEPALYGIGVFHQKRGLWLDALKAYERQLHQSPLLGPLHYRIGMAHDRLYQWEEAASSYRNAIALESRKPMPSWHYRLGFVLERQERWIEAATAYRAAIALSSKHIPYWFYRLGYVLEQASMYEAACAAYLGTRVDPMLPAANGLALPEDETPASSLSVAAQSDREAVERYLAGFSCVRLMADALAQDRTRAAHHFQLAESLERDGDWDAAAESYRDGLLRSSDHYPSMYYRYGFVLSKAGRFDDACRALRNTRLIQRPHGVSEEPLQKDEGLRILTSYVEYAECLPINDRAILYESFNGNSMACNPLAMFEYLITHPEYGSYLHIWVLNDLTRVRHEYRHLPNVVFVQKPSDGYLRHLATAKFLINNSGFPPYFVRRPEQKYLATWHGTPLKTLGKEQKYKFYDHKRTQRNFVQATHIISPNGHTTAIQLDSYDIRPLFTGLFAETGYPRIDLTLNNDSQRKARILERMGLVADRPIVLYAPTWRGTLDEVSFDTSRLEHDLAALSKLDCQLIFRGHSLLERVMTHDDVPGQVVPADIDTNELLSVVDVLITDYSSVFFDYLATGKPIIYYIYDLEEYEEERGLYFQMEEMPGFKCRTIEELFSALSQALAGEGIDHDHVAAARAIYNAHDDGNATQRVVDFFFETADSHLIEFRKQERTTIILNGGSFQPNGITTSFINLVKSIDRSRYDVIVGFSPGPIEASVDSLSQFRSLPPDIYAVPRYGNMPMTLEERSIRRRYQDNLVSLNNDMRRILERAYTREFLRVFGMKRYDVSIAFSGYDYFWASVLLMGPSAARKVIYLHNDMYSEHIARFPELRLIFDLYRYADSLTSVSEQTCAHNREQLSGRFEVDERKFVHCENMSNPEEIIARSKLPLENEADESIFSGPGPVFVNIARLSVEKDHEKLIKAFSVFHRDRPTARLVILGAGPLEQHLRRMLSEYGMEEAVHLLGYRSNPYPYLRKADCFILSSNHEGQPMTLLEALVLGKKIIATDIVGNRSVLQGRPGLLVENSVDGLVRGMSGFAHESAGGGFDWTAYQRDSISTFYQRVLGLHVPVK